MAPYPVEAIKKIGLVFRQNTLAVILYPNYGLFCSTFRCLRIFPFIFPALFLFPTPQFQAYHDLTAILAVFEGIAGQVGQDLLHPSFIYGGGNNLLGSL